jgi:peptidoglycan hydrolase CwlO-like protein
MDKFREKIATMVFRLTSIVLGVCAYLIPLTGLAQGGGGEGSGGGGGILEGLADLGGWLAMPFTWVLAKFSEFIFYLVGFFSTMAASLMNWSVEFFVLQMPELIEEMDAINTLWVVLRDIGNMVFIFLILFAAISIILDNDKFDAKNILIKVVVVALFVNFSLFITQVVVDVSNVLALQIYENISTPGGGDANLANVIASQLNLSSLNAEPSWSQLANEGGVYSKLAIARLFGAVLNFAVGFVMIAIAALLGIRFLVLVLLMVGSPIAFVAFTLPNVSFGQDWWDWLIRESFFAPALMLMLYITFYLARNLKEGLGLGTNSELMKAIIEPSGNVGIVAFFGVVIGMLVASIIIARQMGATGADKVIGTSSAAYGWVGRQTAGRAGRAMQNSQYLKEKATDKNASAVSRYLSQKTIEGGRKAADSSFDVRNTGAFEAVDSENGSLDSSFGQREGGYNEIREEQQEFLQEQREELEELTAEEKEQVAKAKNKKKEIEKNIEKTDKDIKKFNSAINNRNQYLNQRDDATSGSPQEKRAEQRIKDLARTTKEIDVSPSDSVDDLVDKLDNLEAIRDQYKADKEIKKDEKSRLDAITKIGQERGEKFQEIMSEQKSVLDSVASGSKKLVNYFSNRAGRGDLFDSTESRLTQKTKDYRLFAAKDIDDIDNIGEGKNVSPKRDQRIADNLKGNI